MDSVTENITKVIELYDKQKGIVAVGLQSMDGTDEKGGIKHGAERHPSEGDRGL